MRLFRHGRKSELLVILAIFHSFSWSISTEAQVLPEAEDSHPSLALESRFAEAVIAYNKRQTALALQILDELITKEPSKKEYLEMKALTLKGMAAPDQSIDVYQRLYNLATDAEKGPYAFELGTLLSQKGKNAEAKTYFEKAVALNFNATASHFYLGLGAYQQLNYTEAEAHFSKVADSDLPPYSVIAKYYLGICYFKLNNGAQGIQELVEVKSLTAGAENGDVTKTIADATEKMLAPFSLGQWFGNALLQSQYDSNVQQLPTGASNPTGGTNPGTLKMNLSGGGGYMSAPLKPIQLVAAYRASYNYNFNSSTKGFEYFTNNLSLFANYHALARTSAGLKLDTNFVFQNSLVDPTNTQGAYQYQKYNFTAGFGPYFRHQLTREWKLEAELGVRTQTFYSDPNLSGMKYNSRISFRSDQRNAYFNPGTSLVYENNRANGDDYYSSSYGLGILNTMTFPASVIFSQALDVLFTQYSKSILSRSDQNYSFKLGASKVLNAKVSMMADLSYTTNDSNISQSYSYHQWVTSLGMGYTF